MAAQRTATARESADPASDDPADSASAWADDSAAADSASGSPPAASSGMGSGTAAARATRRASATRRARWYRLMLIGRTEGILQKERRFR